MIVAVSASFWGTTREWGRQFQLSIAGEIRCGVGDHMGGGKDGDGGGVELAAGVGGLEAAGDIALVDLGDDVAREAIGLAVEFYRLEVDGGEGSEAKILGRLLGDGALDVGD